ncbi:alanine dehydrogenase [Terrabacter sp. Root85]|uniref:N(5)-(carboxyethyl)ornithine synthase n=1 Tax=unclassified Terrabacter TaxID=2630222 RepID=UPI0006F8FFA9|nr:MULTISPECIES: N(5)-(carboxyethyl)ornithine synthase [unclassified Terrabacter]KRC89518.1 alanine dehydrogenase [Terrabacter sp. Root85]KRF48233.1 alanine dehydrogenase [Terrabacter sp. Soil811]
MVQLSLGVMARSLKENEHRLPLHPKHVDRIPEELRERIFLETGYGDRHGVSDDQLERYVGGFLSREELVAQCDVILAPKPLLSDISALRVGQVLWGWPHCVQDAELTQVAIDRKLTLIAFEAMNHWNKDGSFSLHVFHKNNELAGYCSVLHALQIAGITGDYGPQRRAVVIGFGATARGAVTALNALGIGDVDVLTHRQKAAVASPIHSARIVHFDTDDTTARVSHAVTEDGPVALGEFLAEHDIVVNCVLQDTDAPITFMTDDDLKRMTPGSIVIDVSCDEGMGFSWAKPTTFTDPTFLVGDHVLYYAVDHSPSYLWDAATWEISEALLPFLPTVMGGPEAWDANSTVRRAIEIRDGEIQNPAILSFQGRSPKHPHLPLAT